MDLTEGAILAIQKPAREAEQLTKAVRIIDTPDPRKKLLVHGSTMEDLVVPPPPRKHTVYSLADLIAYAQTQAGAVVWYSAESVIVVLDDEDRRDTVTFPLEGSEAWMALKSLQQASQGLTQKEFIRLLRLYLAASADTITTFRKLSFNQQINAAGEVQKSRESLGRSINAEVQGTSELPDELIVRVPIYQSRGERLTYTVRLLLEYDTQNQRILVTPEPGAMQEAEESHQADIARRLESVRDGMPDDVEIAIYCGRP